MAQSKEERAERRRLYRLAHKEERLAYNREWSARNPLRKAACSLRYNKANRVKNREQKRGYCRSLRGRLATLNSQARRRGLGFTPLFPNPFPKDMLVDWHHVSDVYVVAVPRDIHRANYAGNDAQKHRALLVPIINEIYCGRSYSLRTEAVMGT